MLYHMDQVFPLTAEEAEPQELDTITEFNVGQSEECPICIHEYSQDMSTGQVAFLLTYSLCVIRQEPTLQSYKQCRCRSAAQSPLAMIWPGDRFCDVQLLSISHKTQWKM